MIPKELHVNRIVETFIEEAGVLAAANPQEWACIQEAAALWSLKFPGCKDKGVRDFIAFLFDRPDPIRVKGKNQERFRLRRVWLNSGKYFAVTLFWEWLCTQSGWFIWHDERGGTMSGCRLQTCLNRKPGEGGMLEKSLLSALWSGSLRPDSSKMTLPNGFEAKPSFRSPCCKSCKSAKVPKGLIFNHLNC